MKRKTFLFSLAIILICSCITDDFLEDRPFVGIRIEITNLTNQEYNNLKLHIGGLKDSTFVSTDFFELPSIIIRPNDSFFQLITFDESRWKTDLNKIFEISNNAYFALEFEDGKIVLLEESFQESGLVSFSVINENNKIKEKYGGQLSVSIEESNITATAVFREDTIFRP